MSARLQGARRRRGVHEHDGYEDVEGGAVEDGQRDLLAGERVRGGVRRFQHRRRACRDLHCYLTLPRNLLIDQKLQTLLYI